MKPRTLKRLKDARTYAGHSLSALDRFGPSLAEDVHASLSLQPSVEVTGEALRAILETDAEFAAQWFDLPWKEAVRLRTRLAHGYSNIETDFLMETVRDEFPSLDAKPDAILAELS